jgi:hypothetical protein
MDEARAQLLERVIGADNLKLKTENSKLITRLQDLTGQPGQTLW